MHTLTKCWHTHRMCGTTIPTVLMAVRNYIICFSVCGMIDLFLRGERLSNKERDPLVRVSSERVDCSPLSVYVQTPIDTPTCMPFLHTYKSPTTLKASIVEVNHIDYLVKGLLSVLLGNLWSQLWCRSYSDMSPKDQCRTNTAPSSIAGDYPHKLPTC